MAKLTGDMIKPGLHLFIQGYSGMKSIPRKIEVVTGEVEKENGNRLQIILIDCEKQFSGVSMDWDASKWYIYLGDRGVDPYRYDNRPCQVFTTQEEMQAAIDSWAGENPNFMKDKEQ